MGEMQCRLPWEAEVILRVVLVFIGKAVFIM